MAMFGYEASGFNGYEFKTTFWGDFTVADAFGERAVKDTYKDALQWKGDAEYITELALVLNWKCWQHYESGNEKLCELYRELYYDIDDWCCGNLEGDSLEYYLRTTD